MKRSKTILAALLISTLCEFAYSADKNSTPVWQSTDGRALPQQRLSVPPNSILGIGASRCSDFVDTYDSMRKIKSGESISDPTQVAAIAAAYGDFTGTLGGFLASSMMFNGDKTLPTRDYNHAMSLIYGTCKDHLDARYIDIAYIMSHTLFGRSLRR
jgi:hypothetical protein